MSKKKIITKKFKSEELQDIGLDTYCDVNDKLEDGWKVVGNERTGERRWVSEHTLYFQEPGQNSNEAWAVDYSEGLTENQEDNGEYPFAEEEVECYLVVGVPVTTIEWKVKYVD